MIQLNLKLQLLVYILYRKNINIKFTIEKNIFHSKKRPMHFTNGPKMYAKCQNFEILTLCKCRGLQGESFDEKIMGFG